MPRWSDFRKKNVGNNSLQDKDISQRGATLQMVIF